MKHFLQFADAVDVMPLLHQLYMRNDMWQPGKDEFAECGVIALRKDSVFQPWMEILPQARPIIFQLMARVEGTELGSVQILDLAPECAIPLNHTPPPSGFWRYFITLQSSPGMVLCCLEEQITPFTGSAWWSRGPWSMKNGGNVDWIALLVDVKC